MIIMKKIATFFILLLFSYVVSYSQQVVVSEYYNTGGPTSEWTELIVTQDGTNLVGYVIRDNSSWGEETWQGGIKFKNIPMWQNVRAGTIIVINHRGYAQDADIDDGFVEIGAADNSYFDEYMSAGNPNEWNTRALNLNCCHEMLQVLDASGNHVHLLGNMDHESNTYLGVSGPKVCNSNSTGNNSICVVPGANLAAYSAGYTDAETALCSNPTKGLPNNVPGRVDINQLFWRSLRQPSSNPASNLRATPNIDNVALSWNTSSSDNDPIQGYMLVRFKNSEAGNAQNPQDSYDYQVGDKLGSAEIIAFLPELSTNSYIDKLQVDCGSEYVYRLYVYRFKPDDNGVGTGNPKSARGRAFLEDQFTESNVLIKPLIPKPKLSTPNNDLIFCDNQRIKIQSDAMLAANLKFEWFKDNVIVPNENDNFLIVSKAGSYRLRITDVNTGCEGISDNIILDFISAPHAYILDVSTSFTFQRDTIISLCKGEEKSLRGVILPASADSKYSWIKDGAPYKQDVSEIIPDGNGQYRFIASSAGKCPDTSVTITVKIVNNDFALNPASINFDADLSPQQNVTITNNSDNDIIINQGDVVITGQGFSIVNPQFPYTIPAKQSIVVAVKFTIAGYGTRTGKLTLNLKCATAQSIDLQGERINQGATRLDAIPTSASFGRIAIGCENLPDTLIKLYATGPENVLVRSSYFTKKFFSVQNKFAPDTLLNSNDSMVVNYNMTASTPGIYHDTLLIPYFIDSKPDAVTDTLRIPISAELYTPSLGFDYNKIDLGNITSCGSSLDSFLIIENKNGFDITISKDPNGMIIKNKPLTIPANQKDTVFFHVDFSSKSDLVVNFEYLPCMLQSQDFTITPPQSSILVDLIPDTLNMGLINNCQSPGNVSISLDIHVSGTGASIGDILHVGTGFKTNITKDMPLNDGDNNFLLTIQSVSPKVYKDSIIFTIMPCGDRVVAYINAERRSPSDLTFVKDTVDFGTAPLSVAGRDTVLVINTDDTFDMSVDSIPNISPFVITNYISSDFPVRAKPGDTLKFAVEYPRIAEGSPVVSSKIYISSPCPQAKNILLKGKTIDTTTFGIALKIDDNPQAFLFKDYTMSLNVNRVGSWEYRQARIEYFAIYLSYDPSLLYFRSIDQGRAISGNTEFYKTYEDVIGKIKISANVLDSTKLKDGEWIKLTYVPLLGSGLDARVSVDSIVFRSKRGINIDQDTGFVYITGNCDLTGRFAQINQPVGLNILKSNVVSNSVEIEFTVATEDNTTLNIYDAQGTMVQNVIDRSLTPGSYSANINLNEYPDGLYFVNMKSGAANRTIKFIVVK